MLFCRFKMLPKLVKKFWNYGAGRMTLAAFCAHSVSISIGMVQGYSAILLPQLEEDPHFQPDSNQESWLASLGAISNPLGSILSGLLAEYLGRKRSMQLSSIPFLVGWLCIGFAKDLPLIYVGRFISGIAGGMSTASYTYVGEISTPESRGILQTLGPICASFGILLTYILGYCVPWWLVAFISITFSTFTIVAVHFIPESPAHLIKHKQPQKSFESYLWLRRNIGLAEQEVAKHTPVEETSKKSTKEIYLSAVTIKPFLIMVTLFFLQELSGIYTILFYAVNFFQQTNLNMNNYVCSIIIGAIRLVMSIAGALLINKFGRRILCICSSAGMSVAMLVMVVYFRYYESNPLEPKFFPMLPLLCVVVNVMFNMIGMLPIPWILVGEVFPLEVRPIVSGIVICIAQCFIFLFVKIWPDMLQLLNFSGTLATFLVAAVIALIFCKYILPETKNKTLQEIECYFNNNCSFESHVSGYENKGFVIAPENVKNDIFSVQVR